MSYVFLNSNSEAKTDMIVNKLFELKPQSEVDGFRKTQKDSISQILSETETGVEIMDFLIDNIKLQNSSFQKKWENGKTSTFDELLLLKEKYKGNKNSPNSFSTDFRFKSSYIPFSETEKQSILDENQNKSNKRKNSYHQILGLLNEELDILKYIHLKNQNFKKINHRAFNRSRTNNKFLTKNNLKNRVDNILNNSQEAYEKNLTDLKNYKRKFLGLKDYIEDLDKGRDKNSNLKETLDNLMKTTTKYDLDDETYIRVAHEVCKGIKNKNLQFTNDNFSLKGEPKLQIMSININNISHISNKSYTIKNSSKKSILAVKKPTYKEDRKESPEQPIIKFNDKIFDSFISADIEKGSFIKNEYVREKMNAPKKMAFNNTAPETFQDTLEDEDILDESVVCLEDMSVNNPKIINYELKAYRLGYYFNDTKCIIEGERIESSYCFVK
jgi:hypothetical protein